MLTGELFFLMREHFPTREGESSRRQGSKKNISSKLRKGTLAPPVIGGGWNGIRRREKGPFSSREGELGGGMTFIQLLAFFKAHF